MITDLEGKRQRAGTEVPLLQAPAGPCCREQEHWAGLVFTACRQARNLQPLTTALKTLGTALVPVGVWASGHWLDWGWIFPHVRGS